MHKFSALNCADLIGWFWTSHFELGICAFVPRRIEYKFSISMFLKQNKKKIRKKNFNDI